MGSQDQIQTKEGVLMYKSIKYFEEECINKFEEMENDFLREPEKFAEYVLALTDELHKLGTRMIQETLEEMDQMLQQSGLRMKKWHVDSHDTKQLITSLGTVNFQKTYFKNIETGEREYLLDRIMGLEKKQRITDDAEAKILEEAVQTTYARAGEAVSLGAGVKKQTVKNKLHQLKIPQVEISVTEKKTVDYLYIEADEDHVSLQFREKKGDLVQGEHKQKNNCLITKMVYVHEGVERVAPKSKRRRLINPYYFCGTSYGETNKEFWDRIYKYLDEHYELSKVKRIYINSDGGTWIKSGMRQIAGIIFVLDGFHLEQYLTKMTSHMKDSKDDAKRELKDTIRSRTKSDFEAFAERLTWYAQSDSDVERIEKSKEYILSNWTAAKLRLRHKEGVVGSSTEGHISHGLSSRMSSRPMGWSIVGATKMAELRAYYLNGGNMLELVRYQKEEEELPKAAGAEYNVISSSQVLVSERNRHEELGKYMSAITHSLPEQMKKKFYFQTNIWGL